MPAGAKERKPAKPARPVQLAAFDRCPEVLDQADAIGSRCRKLAGHDLEPDPTEHKNMAGKAW